jgi:peptidoglycan/LPS O-acetylase OafA/YrhL
LLKPDLKYYKILDGLRGIAALMVMAFHFIPGADAARHPVLHLIHKVAVFGQTGVTLFFVLSGFLITRILLTAKTQKNYFLNFYIKRALRIFPLYYLGLIIFYLAMPLFTGIWTNKQQHIWMYWLYLQSLSDTFLWGATGPQHFWSLGVEEHFYLFWPLVVYYTTTKGLPKVIAVIVALALICRCVLIYFGYGTFYFTLSVMDALAIGALLAWLEREDKLRLIKFNYVIGCCLVLLLPTWLFTGGKGLNWVQVIKFPIMSFFYMGIIGKLITIDAGEKKSLLLTLLGYTGKISYGLYVFHPFCFAIVYKYCPFSNIWLLLLSGFALSYLTASVSFYAYEIRFIKLKRYFEIGGWRNKQVLEAKA